MNIKPFGEINPENLKEYYNGEIFFQGEKVEVDINFESDSVKPEVLEKIKNLMAGIQNYIKKAFDEVSKDYDLGEESESREYLDRHLEIFTEEQIKIVFGTMDVDKGIFFNKLSIFRIGIYPEDYESYILFQISIPEEYTDFILAVTFNSDGELDYISMDS